MSDDVKVDRRRMRLDLLSALDDIENAQLHLSRLLKRTRIDLLLSKRHIHQESGIDRSTIANWENMRSVPRRETLEEFIALFVHPGKDGRKWS